MDHTASLLLPWTARELPKDRIPAEGVHEIAVAVEACIGPADAALVAQGLAYAVHLIVVPTARKREKLLFEICEPRRLLREEHVTALELCGLYGHSDFLVMLGLDRNDREMRRLKFLDQRCPESGVFNQDLGGLVQLRMLRSRFVLQGRIVKAAA